MSRREPTCESDVGPQPGVHKCLDLQMLEGWENIFLKSSYAGKVETLYRAHHCISAILGCRILWGCFRSVCRISYIIRWTQYKMEIQSWVEVEGSTLPPTDPK